MKKIALFYIIVVLLDTSVYAINKSDTILKTGWLVYYHDHIIWFESNLNKNSSHNTFFSQKKYNNGLMIDYSFDAHRFSSIATKHKINVLFYDSTSTSMPDYTLLDSIYLVPVVAKTVAESKPISELLQPRGLTFRNVSEVTLIYNFDANYHILNIQLLRKRDIKKLKKIKSNLQ